MAGHSENLSVAATRMDVFLRTLVSETRFGF